MFIKQQLELFLESFNYEVCQEGPWLNDTHKKPRRSLTPFNLRTEQLQERVRELELALHEARTQSEQERNEFQKSQARTLNELDELMIQNESLIHEMARVRESLKTANMGLETTHHEVLRLEEELDLLQMEHAQLQKQNQTMQQDLLHLRSQSTPLAKLAKTNPVIKKTRHPKSA